MRTASVEWNVPGKYGPHGELFLFLVKKEPATMTGSETFSPFSTADTADVLKKCALIALHSIPEEEKGSESGCRAPDLGDTWRFGCPKGPMWDSEDESRSEDESVSSRGSREDTVCNDARCTSSGCMGLVTRSLSS